MTATSQGRLPLDELVRLPNYYMPAVNDQGGCLAYYADHSGRMELYLLDLPDGQPRQLSHGEVPRALHAGFVWNRAGTRIVFSKDLDGNEQHDLCAIDTATGAVTRLTDHPGCQEYPVQFSPDDAWLLVATNREGQMNLWRMRPDGSDYHRLTDHPFPVSAGIYSPDAVHIAYTTNESRDLGNSDGYVMRADGSERRRVFRVSEGTREAITDWSPDGRFLAVVSDATGDNRAGLLEVATGEVRWLSEEGSSETPAGFSKDGRWLACMQNRDSQVRPVLYEVASGARRLLNLPPGVAAGTDFALNSAAVVISYTSETARPTLLLYRLADDTSTELLAPVYGNIDPARFVPSEHVWYTSADGTRVPALLYRPRDAAPGARLPAVVNVHGGPTAQFFRGFDPFAQYLVSAGYVVLEPNPRGSTGYGRAYREANRHDWGGGDLEDIVAGGEYLRSLPEVDRERIGILGGSYGGYMTYVATTRRPEMWKAGAAFVGITDLRLLYDNSMEHFKYYLRQQLGDPEENAALWHERSALTHAANLRANLLILHGVNDPRCPIEQARVFRDALLAAGRTLGEDFEYVEFADQGHGSTDAEQRLRALTLMVDFFERTL